MCFLLYADRPHLHDNMTWGHQRAYRNLLALLVLEKWIDIFKTLIAYHASLWWAFCNENTVVYGLPEQSDGSSHWFQNMMLCSHSPPWRWRVSCGALSHQMLCYLKTVGGKRHSCLSMSLTAELLIGTCYGLYACQRVACLNLRTFLALQIGLKY